MGKSGQNIDQTNSQSRLFESGSRSFLCDKKPANTDYNDQSIKSLTYGKLNRYNSSTSLSNYNSRKFLKDHQQNALISRGDELNSMGSLPDYNRRNLRESQVDDQNPNPRVKSPEPTPRLDRDRIKNRSSIPYKDEPPNPETTPF